MEPLVPMTEHQPVNKIHMWMLILLGWTAVFSLIAVGLLLTKGSTSISSSDISLACQNGTLNGITTNLTRISDACNTETEGTPAPAATISVKGTEFYPGFSVPASWNIFGDWTNAGSQTSYTVLLSDQPMIITSFGSDQPFPTKIQLTTAPVPSDVPADKQSAYIASQFTDTSYSNTATTSKSIANGTLYTTTTTHTSELRGAETKTVLHFFGKTMFTDITYTVGSADSAWTAFVGSLDWSGIK